MRLRCAPKRANLFYCQAKERFVTIVSSCFRNDSTRGQPEEASQMTAKPRAILVILILIAFVAVVAYARELGAREAREKIAKALGIDKPDRIHIESINAGSGNDAIVEARINTAFHFNVDKQGDWQAVEVRTGDRDWESIELIQTAVRKEKVLRTTADLRSIVTALEAFRRERSYYVNADTNSALIDNLAPRYTDMIIRLDAWSHE